MPENTFTNLRMAVFKAYVFNNKTIHINEEDIKQCLVFHINENNDFDNYSFQFSEISILQQMNKFLRNNY